MKEDERLYTDKEGCYRKLHELRKTLGISDKEAEKALKDLNKTKRLTRSKRAGGKRKPGAGAPKGNKNGVALKDPDIRQLAYQSYCDHLAQGRGKKSWFFRLGDFHCCWATMDKYIEDNIEFDPSKKHEADANGFKWWENLIRDSSSGANTKISTATLQMALRNMYGWDKEKKQEEVTQDIIGRFDSLMMQLNRLQNDQ